MNPIKKNLLLLCAFCFFMVAARIIKTENLSFIFLFWNLFLAFVPYWLSSYLLKRSDSNYFKLVALSMLWVLFLPNAPYILTDLFHLHKRVYLPIWFDLVLIMSFATTGLYLFYLSINQMIEFVKVKFPQLHKPFFLMLLFVAVSYGVYIGRFLRVNSWDIIDPIGLAKTCLLPLFDLPGLKDVCCFTFIYSIFLAFLYLIFKPLFKSEKYDV